MSPGTRISGLAAALLDFVYPPHCPACESWQAPGDREALCCRCIEGIRAPLGPRCRRCGAPEAAGTPDRGASGPGCPNCAGWGPAAFSRAVVLTDLTGPVQSAVHALKFSGIQGIGTLFGRLLATAPETAGGLSGLDLLVPVPLHPARRRERGFNQAGLIARGAGEALGVPVRSDLVRRLRPTRQQARLEASERAGNLAGAFGPGRRPARGGLSLRAIGLVDDVLTTGSTLSACAAALGAASPGAEIRAVAVASPFRRPR